MHDEGIQIKFDLTVDVLQKVVRNVLHEAGAILEFVYWLLELEKEYMCEDKGMFSIKKKKKFLKTKFVIKEKWSFF